MAPTRYLFRILTIAATLPVTLGTVASAQHGSSEPGIVSFLSAVNSIGDEIKDLNAEKSVTSNDIHLISVQKLSNSGNAATLNRAIAKNGVQIAALRDTLKGNPAVVAKLAASGVPLDQVVAMDVQVGSEINIFYQ